MAARANPVSFGCFVLKSDAIKGIRVWFAEEEIEIHYPARMLVPATPYAAEPVVPT